MSSPEAIETVVIGAGQAGLSTGHHLQRRGAEFVILTSDARVGDTWRRRWDSLRLFSPAFYNHLPGLPFPADDPDHLPVKDEMADYLETYAEHFDLPVRTGTTVHALSPEGGGFLLQTDAGPVRTRHVVVATGAYRHPRIPAFAAELDDAIRQLHSSTYRNPDGLRPGDALVVGAANSGTQIAIDIAEAGGRSVWLSGRDTGRLPRRLLGRDIYRWIGPTVLRLSLDGPFGRRIKEKTSDRGDPVFKPVHARLAGLPVERVGRTTGVRGGRPVVGEGRALDVANVVWCTGFGYDFSWIDLDVFDADGAPRHHRGVVEEAPGLYFVGLRFLYRLNSSLIGGVGEDAAYVAAHIADGVS